MIGSTQKINYFQKFRPGSSTLRISSFHVLCKLVQACTSWYKHRKDFCRFADGETSSCAEAAAADVVAVAMAVAAEGEEEEELLLLLLVVVGFLDEGGLQFRKEVQTLHSFPFGPRTIPGGREVVGVPSVLLLLMVIVNR